LSAGASNGHAVNMPSGDAVYLVSGPAVQETTAVS